MEGDHRSLVHFDARQRSLGSMPLRSAWKTMCSTATVSGTFSHLCCRRRSRGRGVVPGCPWRWLPERPQPPGKTRMSGQRRNWVDDPLTSKAGECARVLPGANHSLSSSTVGCPAGSERAVPMVSRAGQTGRRKWSFFFPGGSGRGGKGRRWPPRQDCWKGAAQVENARFLLVLCCVAGPFGWLVGRAGGVGLPPPPPVEGRR